MIVACVENTFAIWQVETDPEVTVGDFSGAWIVDEGGVRGFAEQAQWLEERHDQAAMLRLLLRYPVVCVNEQSEKALRELLSMTGSQGANVQDERDAGAQGAAEQDAGAQGAVSQVVSIVDWEAVEQNAAEALELAKKHFTETFSAKKQQPAWGTIARRETETAQDTETNTAIKTAENTENHAQQRATAEALAYARSLRTWIRQWNTFDKLRVRRLGEQRAEYVELSGVPLELRVTL